jgi:hypothetical protein
MAVAGSPFPSAASPATARAGASGATLTGNAGRTIGATCLGTELGGAGIETAQSHGRSDGQQSRRVGAASQPASAPQLSAAGAKAMSATASHSVKTCATIRIVPAA